MSSVWPPANARSAGVSDSTNAQGPCGASVCSSCAAAHRLITNCVQLSLKRLPARLPAESRQLHCIASCSRCKAGTRDLYREVSSQGLSSMACADAKPIISKRSKQGAPGGSRRRSTPPMPATCRGSPAAARQSPAAHPAAPHTARAGRSCPPAHAAVCTLAAGSGAWTCGCLPRSRLRPWLSKRGAGETVPAAKEHTESAEERTGPRRARSPSRSGLCAPAAGFGTCRRKIPKTVTVGDSSRLPAICHICLVGTSAFAPDSASRLRPGSIPFIKVRPERWCSRVEILVDAPVHCLCRRLLTSGCRSSAVRSYLKREMQIKTSIADLTALSAPAVGATRRRCLANRA